MNNIFQSEYWEKFKLNTGYQKSFRVEEVLVLLKELPFGWSMLYSPMVDASKLETVNNRQFIKQIKKIAQENKAIFYRLEFDLPKSVDLNISKLGFVKSFEEMQPEHTRVLDLTKDERELLGEMRPKGRYNIKIALSKGVKVLDDNSVDNFYQMYEKTAKRHHISYRQKKYFDGLLENLSQNGYSRVYTAYLEDEESKNKSIPLSSAIMVYSGSKAIYMFGSSSDEYKNLMAPYLLQWEMIKKAKQAGYKTYDFFGIAPNDNPNHPWSGVTRFKRQFGGEQINTIGSFDLILNRPKYLLFKIAEKIRRR